MYLDNSETGMREEGAGLVPQLAMMIRALLASPVRNTLFLLGGAVFLVIVATAYGQIRLNSWNRPFYDALAHRDFDGFVTQLGVFAIIAGALLVLNVAQRWLAEMLKLKFREGLVKDLIGEWLKPHRATALEKMGPEGVNPDQRMHEDARHLTELSSDLGVQLVQSSILLVTFVDVLWGISGSFVFHVGERFFLYPRLHGVGRLPLCRFGLTFELLGGRNLVWRNADRYQRESELRTTLNRISEHIEIIEQDSEEAMAAEHLALDLKGVLKAMRKLVTGLTELTWVTAGYGWLTLVAPILVAAPAYFAGSLSFGGMMMAAGAFNQVQSSLRWFVDNFSTIADWRATLLRVADFRRALLEYDAIAADAVPRPEAG